MTIEAWLAFCATETVLCFAPGPAVLYVISVALARGAAPGIAASLGILSGNAFYFLLSAIGVAGVIVTSHELFALLKWAGAAYLVWMGVRMLLSRQDTRPDAASRVAERSFLRGFIVQAANPKALIFFVALLPQFIDPRLSVGFQVGVLGVSSVLIEFCVLALYVAAAARARALTGGRLAGAVERVGGAFLLAAGARLALARQE